MTLSKFVEFSFTSLSLLNREEGNVNAISAKYTPIGGAYLYHEWQREGVGSVTKLTEKDAQCVF